jgi:hypothetical protein
LGGVSESAHFMPRAVPPPRIWKATSSGGSQRKADCPCHPARHRRSPSVSYRRRRLSACGAMGDRCSRGARLARETRVNCRRSCGSRSILGAPGSYSAATTFSALDSASAISVSFCWT